MDLENQIQKLKEKVKRLELEMKTIKGLLTMERAKFRVLKNAMRI